VADPTVDEFVSAFVEPLVLGGRVVVDGLIAPTAVTAWMRSPNPDATRLVRVCDAARTRLSRLGAVGPIDTLPLDAIALAAVWYDLLAMTHPEATGRSGLRKVARHWCVALLEWVRVPVSRFEVALRHAVLGRIGELGRVDTHVEFWAGYADFVGVAPPRALVALPGVRRVRESRRRVDLFSLLSSLEVKGSASADVPDLTDVTRAALAASPLTDIILADRPAPWSFRWTPASINAIADGCIRGAAHRAVLARGAASVRALEQATLAAMRMGAPRAVAETLLRFHLEMLCLDALGHRGGSAPAPTGGSAHQGAATSVSQPRAMDAYLRLGAERAAPWLGLPVDTLRRVLPADPVRSAVKDPPSAPLLQGAGLMEAAVS
jgi:hypothetical protein